MHDIIIIAVINQFCLEGMSFERKSSQFVHFLDMGKNHTELLQLSYGMKTRGCTNLQSCPFRAPAGVQRP